MLPTASCTISYRESIASNGYNKVNHNHIQCYCTWEVCCRYERYYRHLTCRGAIASAARSPNACPPNKCPAANATARNTKITMMDSKPASIMPFKFRTSKASKGCQGTLPDNGVYRFTKTFSPSRCEAPDNRT